MPKKFTGENSKSAAARARKSATKEAESIKKQKQAEEAYWRDDDKHLAKKQQRKQDTEKKKQEQLLKKQEAKALLEKELKDISVNTSRQNPIKITRAQIQAENEKRNAAAQGQVIKKEKSKTHIEQPLEENINRLLPEEHATTIDEAIKMLSVEERDGEDIHPEKRMKSAFLAYEEKNLPRLKEENPTLRMSQLKQLLFKEWQKSSENPLNKI